MSSNSKIRVEFGGILDLPLSKTKIIDKEANNFFKNREKYYLDRIKEDKFLSKF